MSQRINIRASQAAVASSLVGPFIRIVPYTARLYLLRRSTFPISAIIAGFILLSFQLPRLPIGLSPVSPLTLFKLLQS